MTQLPMFWTVTATSVYRVRDGLPHLFEGDGPVVKKIFLRGKSKIPPGERLTNGSLVGISSTGIQLFTSYKRSQSPDDTARFGGHTSPIVGLFLNEEDAIRCFESGDTEMCSPRWREHTRAVVQAIGKDHPVFRFSELDPVVLPHLES